MISRVSDMLALVFVIYKHPHRKRKQHKLLIIIPYFLTPNSFQKKQKSELSKMFNQNVWPLLGKTGQSTSEKNNSDLKSV